MTSPIPLIVTRSDVEPYYYLSKNLTDDEFNTYVLEAQTQDLGFYLGEDLAYNIIINYDTTGIYKTLYDGTTYEYKEGYTRYYLGVKSLLIWYVIQRIVNSGRFKSTGSGVVKKKINNSDQLKQQELKALNGRVRSNLYKYYKSFQDYMSENSATYPEWEGAREFERHKN